MHFDCVLKASAILLTTYSTCNLLYLYLLPTLPTPIVLGFAVSVLRVDEFEHRLKRYKNAHAAHFTGFVLTLFISANSMYRVTKIQ